MIGIIQGITELLPISSSGHLILVDKILGKEPTVVLLTTLHLGSAVALTLVYWRDIVERLKGANRNKFVKNILIAATPVILFALMAGDNIDDIFYNPTFIAFNLAFWGIVMIVTERYEQKLLKGDSLAPKNALLIGLFQILSLLPGTSRSGITTMSGMWTGQEKSKALDFSFMLGIPLLFGAFFFSVIGEGEDVIEKFSSEILIAFLVSLIVSYIAAKVLRAVSKRRFLTFFGIYRIILGIFILMYFIAT